MLKTMKHKLTNALSLLSFTTLLVITSQLVGCNADQPPAAANAGTTTTTVTTPTSNQPNLATAEALNRQLSEIFSERPKAVVGRNEPITLAFRQAIIAPEQLGSSAQQVISFNPAVAGKASFDSVSSISFVPDAPLASGQNYTLTFNPTGLLNLPADLTPLALSFRTPVLELDVKTQGLSPILSDPSHMRFAGTIYSSDYVAADAIEKILQASVQNQALPLTWDHNPAGTEHRFNVASVPRETYATDLLLQWDGTAIAAQGKQSKGKQEIAIPAQKSFGLTRIELEESQTDSGKPYIEITFSDPLNTSQDMTGLVQLDNDKIRLQVEDNRLAVYPSEDITAGEHKLVVHAGIQAADMNLGKLQERYEETIVLEGPKPAVRFVGRGSILPDNQTLQIPIETQAVNAVQVTAFEIYPENIPQFLQNNRLNDSNETGRVGRYLWRKTIPLTVANPNQWNRFTLDATTLLKAKPGTLYRLELAVDRRHSTFACPEGTPPPSETDTPPEDYDDDNTRSASGWDGISDYYANANGNSDYSWEERDNPCSNSYYVYHDETVKSGHNFLASNLGLMAKQESDGTLHVIATDLRTATPAPQVQLTVQNFQGRSLATGTTDNQGFATLAVNATPFLLIAHQGEDTNYLKLNGNTALAISQFDVGGETVQKGIKGYLYGERGVWRPGDDIHLTFVVQDRAKTLPKDHPVTVQLIDPMGKVKQAVTNKQPTGPFYTFTLKTDEQDPTGNWLVKARLGGTTFDKTLKIETIRPNRLKVELDYGTPTLHGYRELPPAVLSAQWLHGGTAAGLKADVSVRLREKKTEFGRFSDYVFDDPSRKLDSDDQQLAEGRLDETGKLEFVKSFQPKQPAPGMLSAWFTSRVHEEGGGFSISKQTLDYYPFENYVGIKLPKGDAERGMLLTDTDQTVDIASLNADGQEVSLNQVQVTLYKIEWKWWWDKTPDSLAEYADASHSSKLQQDIISTQNGHGTWTFQIKYPDWGRYLIRACDLQGQHCTGKTLYVDWPGWAGRAQEEGSGAAAMLRFASDKELYQVGETAQIQLPEADAGRALLTVENSSRILEQRWIEFNGQRTQVSIPITAAMTPNAYVSISLLQPHQQKQNDRPIRLYGIIPLKVENPATRLQPVLHAPEEWRPEGQRTFSVSEQTGKPMTYTLAVVDEGLLGLTRYDTPDLHEALYRKEALGIKTWDLFDDVIGAYGANLERLLALGGGDEAQVDDAANKPKRFPPVVRFLGTFPLAAGQTREHTVDLPSYLGAVRIMLVAAQDDAYGRAEQSVFVRQPLMLLSSLPRTLKINESVDVPLTVFAGTPAIQNVTISAEVDQAFSAAASPVTLNFTAPGEKIAMLKITAGSVPMQGKLRFTASNGQESSSHEVFIDIQAPNVPSLRTEQSVIEPQASWLQTITPHGIAGTNTSVLELSALPNLNLERHVDYLVHYPHGCLEQVTSTAFPQLFLPPLLKQDDPRQKSIERHVKAAIYKLNSYQAANGNLMYWPGSNEAQDWASLYAGHFLLEAQKQGYNIPLSLLTSWLSYQINTAQQWVAVGEDPQAQTPVQAYRLYILALAGKPQLGAMNRLRESDQVSAGARWLLAAAYRQAGQTEAAQQLTQGLLANQLAEPTPDINFSQRLGQLGLRLETVLALQQNQDADQLVSEIATELGSGKAHNTHDLAWALMAVAHYLQTQAAPINAQMTVDQAPPLTLTAAHAFLNQALPSNDAPFQFALRNDNAHKLYATVTTRGVTAQGQEQASNQGLDILATLMDKHGMIVWNNLETFNPPLTLKQGEDYTLTVTVVNPNEYGLQHIALSTLIPSGLEIVQSDLPTKSTVANNTASEGASEEGGEGDEGGSENAASSTPAAGSGLAAGLNYQDVRDDRVLSYFDLEADGSQKVSIRVNAAFLGNFYFPALQAEAMYDPQKRANTAGFAVQIAR